MAAAAGCCLAGSLLHEVPSAASHPSRLRPGSLKPGGEAAFTGTVHHCQFINSSEFKANEAAAWAKRCYLWMSLR